MVKGWDSSKLQATGDAFFLAFFAAHPEEQAHFKKFAGVKNLSGNAAFHAQTLAVFQYLDKMVKGDAVALFKAKVADHKGRSMGAHSWSNVLSFLPGFMGSHGGDAGEWAGICDALKACV
mgnify:FL=1